MIQSNYTIRTEDILHSVISRDWNVPPSLYPSLETYRIHSYAWAKFWCRATPDFYFPMGPDNYKIIVKPNNPSDPSHKTRKLAMKPWIIASFRKPINSKISEPIVLIYSSNVPLEGMSIPEE